MREIKFRAWDGREIVPWEICVDRYNLIWLTSGDAIHIPMQYTGLHDMNDEEIYEGDRVWVTSRDGAQWYTVKFEKGSFVLDDGSEYKQELGGVAEHDDWMVTVGGHIYENSEMLK